MASEADHISLANKNHAALVYLIKASDDYPEWIATIAFYKAVQVVEAVFAARLKFHSNGHDARIAKLKHPEFKEIFKAYRPLYAASLVARYLEDNSSQKLGEPTGKKRYRTFSDYIAPSDVARRLLKKRLDVLEQHAVQFLTDAGRSALLRIGSALR